MVLCSTWEVGAQKTNTTVNPAPQPAVAAKPGATTQSIRRITPQIPNANRFDPGKVFLENANALVFNERRSTDYRVLRGNVKFRRGNMTLSCDSAYFYEASSSLDAFGHVVMVQADTMRVYCDRMHYYGDVQVAKLRRNVKVVNSSMTVTTDSLDYDMLNDVARYFGGGTVVDKTGTRVTSSVGRYEMDTKKVQFTSNVNLTTDKIKLHTDVLDYDMLTHMATIEDQTEILSLEDGNKIYTSSGTYNLATGQGTLYNRSTVKGRDGNTIVGDVMYYDRRNDSGHAQGNVVLTDEKNKQTLRGDNVYYDRRSGQSHAQGNVVVTDDKNQQTLTGDEVFYDRRNDRSKAQGNVVLTDEKSQRVLKGDVMDYDRKTGVGNARGHVVITDAKNKVILQGEVGYHNEKTKESFVTEKALAREFSQKDTIYIHADTLRLFTNSDNERVMLANKYVRFYRKDLQGVCDSAAVNEKDSILNMYRHAVIWSEGRQISGEEINVHVKDSTVDWATLPNNGLLIEHLGEDYYNQLSGRSMKALFADQELRHLDVSGDVEALFFPMENDSTYNKLVNANSAYLTIDMKPKQKVDKIKMWPDVTGTVVPLFLAKRSQLRIDKFRWYDSIRPKEPYDVLVVSDEMRQIFGEAVTKRRTVVRE
jgi:lipopolysaccharide export system protein LptA